MKRDYGKYLMTVGVIMVAIQLIILIFEMVNFDNTDSSIGKSYSAGSYFLSICPGIIGTGLLVVLYVRRFTKGREPILTLCGALLWIVQMLSKYSVGQNLGHFALGNICALIGVVLIIGTVIFDSSVARKST